MSDQVFDDSKNEKATGLGASGSTRKIIAESTQAVHLALHEHSWISRLTLSSLKLQDYQYLLSAYYQFFKSVEQARLLNNAYEPLSLQNYISALNKDLASLKVAPLDMKPDPAHLDTPTKVLAALYVLHGSSFGGRQMNANVKRCHPDAPRNFLELPADPGVWRQLIVELDIVGCDPFSSEGLKSAAKSTFERFGKFVTRHCETCAQTQIRIGQS